MPKNEGFYQFYKTLIFKSLVPTPHIRRVSASKQSKVKEKIKYNHLKK